MHDTAEVRSSTERRRLALEEVVRVAGVGVVVCDANAAITQIDERASRWLTERGGHSALDEILRAAIGGAHVVKTLESSGRSGLSLKVVGAPVRESDQIVGAIAVIEDNTHEKYAEIAQRELVANVGHELKTPIAAMGLLAETLVNERDPVANRNLAERLSQEAVRAAHVVDDLLGLGSRDSRQTTVSSCRALCESAVARLMPAAEARNIALSIVGDDTGIKGEPVDIVSAIHHLVDNAIKYSDENNLVRIEIHENGTTCQIAVVDIGIGIAGAHVDRIFERFYRVDAGSSRAARGTGLGLAIVKHAVERNGGSVRVESIEGRGSTFTIRMKRGVIQ